MNSASPALAFSVLVVLSWLNLSGCDFVPAIAPMGIRIIQGQEEYGQYYRELFVDEATDTLYIGARRYMYSVNLSDLNSTVLPVPIWNALGSTVAQYSDSVATASSWTTADPRGYSPFVQLLKQYGVGNASSSGQSQYFDSLSLKSKLTDFQNSLSFQYSAKNYGNNLLDVAEQYSSIAHSGIAPGTSYRSVCEAQLRILQLFYGRSLRSVVGQDASVLCERHVRGIAWLDGARTKLFTLATGLFGTMQLSVSGTNDYTSWLELEASYTTFLNCLEANAESRYPWLNCVDRRSSPPLVPPQRQASAPGRKTITSAPTQQEQNVLGNWSTGFVPPSPENFVGRRRFCDPRPAPRRITLQLSTAQGSVPHVVSADPLPATPRDTCTTFLMASSFLSGYHPDQATFTLTSDTGNGPDGRMRAVYVLTEIGQDKQLDLNLDYLNLPEMLPLTSSASLALVRLLVNDSTGDVDPSSVVMTNPFKYTWVTSPLTRWGKMVKSGSQEQVPHRPRAVRGLFEEGNYVYFFFREVEWERLSLPEYDIARHHFQLNSYSRALYYPWERAYTGTAFNATSGRPFIRQEEQPGLTREELYAPPLLGWRHAWTQAGSAMTGRVARVCKNDAGMPIGVQDGSVFNLDPGLSLRSFQTFVKTKLTCRVPVPATPHVWRFRRDVARSSDRGSCDAVLLSPDELYGKDLHYRAVSRNETVTLVFGPDSSSQTRNYVKYYYLSHCRGYKWAYVPKPVMLSSAYVEYSELRDVQRIGNTFYGLFSTPLGEEQQSFKDAPSSHRAVYGSAICSFTFDDISSSFRGPFKRRMKNAWRPFSSSAERTQLSPDPYSCDSDPELSKAQGVSSMKIDFLDESQPIDQEMRQFDMRGNASSRLRFFEEDVVGSRTMWNAVRTSPVLSRANVVFEKVVASSVANYTVLFAATSGGEIYKILTWQRARQQCWSTSPSEMDAWIKSPYMKGVLDNKLYPLYNSTASGIASDLTMEKYLTFPDDFLFTSDWNCTPATESRLLSVLKPFGTDKQKIWSMVLHKDHLVLGTDVDVRQVPIYAQCAQYGYCAACAADPHCEWSGTACAARFNSSSTDAQLNLPWIADPALWCSGCQNVSMDVAAGDDVILPGFAGGSSRRTSTGTAATMKWLFNDSSLVLVPGKTMLSQNSSLILLNFSEEWSGVFELRDLASNTCMIRYQLGVKGCRGSDDKCRYDAELAEWTTVYNRFKDPAYQWYLECTKNGPGLCKGAS